VLLTWGGLFLCHILNGIQRIAAIVRLQHSFLLLTST
jgi:hypothetical protein